MSWIKEFSKGAMQIYKGQVLEGFQPIDFFHFYPLWYNLWVSRIAQAIQTTKFDKEEHQKIKIFLPGPSNIRAIIQKIIPSYYANRTNNKPEYCLVANFLATKLQEACPDDPFGLSKNRIHTSSEVAAIIKTTQWNDADINYAGIVGKLIVATSSLVHGLYNDLATDFGWDVYGPYNLKSGQTLLIRHFPDLRPKELWTKKLLASTKEIIIYAIYENVKWKISFVGCHTTSTGLSPVAGMKKFAVYGDGKLLNIDDINELTNELSIKATKIYKEIHKLDFEKLKLLVMWQECYQLKKLFDKARIKWQPTNEMIVSIKNRPLLRDIFPRGKFIKTTKEFKKIFGLDIFEREILLAAE